MIGDPGSTKTGRPSIHSPFVCQVIRLMAPTGLFVSAIYCVLMDHSCILRLCCVMWCILRVALTAVRTDRVQYCQGCLVCVVSSLLLEVALRLDHRFTLTDGNRFARTWALHHFLWYLRQRFQVPMPELHNFGGFLWLFFLLATNACVRTWK